MERRASVRTAIVWETCRAHLGDRVDQTVVDIGGGTGGLAVRVAGLGHQVTVIDPNPDALAALARRAEENQVADRVRGQQGDLASLGSLVPAGSADLVLCHEVLGLVDDPALALAAIRGILRPGGILSLVVNQRHAAVLARAVAGQFAQAQDLLEGAVGADRRFVADELMALVAEGGFTVAEVQGVRVFSDLVPSSLLDADPAAVAGLLGLERIVAARPEYFALAAQLHVVATA